MKITFSKEVHDYIIRNRNTKEQNLKNKLSKSLEAFRWCDNCLHEHFDSYLGYKIECSNCKCKVFKPINFRLELNLRPPKTFINYKVIHKNKPKLYWKLVELEINQSTIIKDYVYQIQNRENHLQNIYL